MFVAEKCVGDENRRSDEKVVMLLWRCSLGNSGTDSSSCKADEVGVDVEMSCDSSGSSNSSSSNGCGNSSSGNHMDGLK